MPIKLEDITIREFSERDLDNAQEYRDYINSLVKEDAKILMNRKQTLEEEKEFVQNSLKKIKENKKVLVVAEHNNNIVGITSIEFDKYRRDHIGVLGISVREGYRGIGLGKTIMSKVVELSKNKLSPKLKIIQLVVYENNKPAIALYKKMGFKKVAKIPKQIQYKGKLISEFVMLLDLK